MNKSRLENIRWPVLRFGAPRCTVAKYKSGELLIKASAKTLKGWRQMDEYFLIDSDGTRHNLRDPEFVDSPRGVSKFLFELTGEVRPVCWNAMNVGVLSVDEIRTLILANFNEYETVWQAYDLGALKYGLASSRSVEEIMEVFG